jgi:hypothetical protein
MTRESGLSGWNARWKAFLNAKTVKKDEDLKSLFFVECRQQCRGARPLRPYNKMTECITGKARKLLVGLRDYGRALVR